MISSSSSSHCWDTPSSVRKARIFVLGLLSFALLLWCALFHSAASQSLVTTPPNRYIGFAPEALHNNRITAGQFRCEDKADTVIPIEKVNDDYCDCPNGQDEPGTSACSHLLPAVPSFYCANKHFVPKMVFASMVNDGICDCCDGSDEWGGRVVCEDTCQKEGAAIVADLKSRVQVVQQGLRIRVQREKEGTRELKQKRQDLKGKKERLEKLEHELEVLGKLKEQMEKQEQIDRELRRQEVTEKEGGEEKQDIDTATSVSAAEEEEEEGEGATDQVDDSSNEDQSVSPIVPPEDIVQQVESNKEEEEEEYKSQASSVPPHHHEHESSSLLPSLIQRINELIRVVLHSYYQFLQWVYGKFNPTEAEKARMEYDAKKREVDDLKREVDELDKVVALDYGEHNQFYALRGKKISYDARDYVYELHFFDRASQKDTRSSGFNSDVSLGKWGKWLQTHTQQLYENGMHCWQGPNRSAQVNFACGSEDRITKVDEPSRCVYMLFVESPSACTKQQDQDLLQELKKFD